MDWTLQIVDISTNPKLMALWRDIMGKEITQLRAWVSGCVMIAEKKDQ